MEGEKLLLSLTDISKKYRNGKNEISALTGVSLNIRAGEKIVITGPSGSGKSTLLNMIGKLDIPDSGMIIYSGNDITFLTEKKASAFRREKVGFVFQDDALVPELTAFENVEIPLVISRRPYAERKAAAMAALERLGLGDKRNSYPASLSGGERQRVSAARAVVNSPEIILADEPTANLDSASAGKVIKSLVSLSDEYGASIIIATHDERVIEQFVNRIALLDGKILR